MMQEAMPEILAPVGAQAQLLAAVRCGADAVYLGTRGFNARRNAENFDGEALREAVAYCHARGVAVHVTVNTLVLDGEMEELERVADAVAQSGADAVIIQDMAVLQLFLNRYPSIARHASTQTAVHNADGAKFLADAGFDRFVLARELSLREIEQITHAVSIEAESFVHGALCMSVSGGCYLSSMIGARSGNRGLCAQPCRLDFRCRGCDHALSLKDMSYLAHMRALAQAGVQSFKIEGRMKRPEYVAAAVTACRASLRGEPYDAQGLRAVFSRSGFTDGYLTGKRDRAMFGYRTHADVTAAEPALSRYAALYRAETPRVALEASFAMDEAGTSLILRAGDASVTVTGPAPQKAKNRPTGMQDVRRSLEKLGGTPFYLQTLDGHIAPDLALAASACNAMRRAGTQALLQKLETVKPHEAAVWTPRAPQPYCPPQRAALWARFAGTAQMCGVSAFSKVILPLEEICLHPQCVQQLGDKLIAELPSLCFPDDAPDLAAHLASCVKLGVTEVMANNIYAIFLARQMGLRVHGGWGLNIANTQAMAFYAEKGLCDTLVSFEISMRQIAALQTELPRGLIGYGYLPLMRMRACPARGENGCGDCDGTAEMTDRTGRRFALACTKRRYTTLFNAEALYVAHRRRAAVDYELLYFTKETRDQAQALLTRYLDGAPPQGAHTGGLYYRSLQ
jgi:putative protease